MSLYLGASTSTEEPAGKCYSSSAACDSRSEFGASCHARTLIREPGQKQNLRKTREQQSYLHAEESQ